MSTPTTSTAPEHYRTLAASDLSNAKLASVFARSDMVKKPTERLLAISREVLKRTAPEQVSYITELAQTSADSAAIAKLGRFPYDRNELMDRLRAVYKSDHPIIQDAHDNHRRRHDAMWRYRTEEAVAIATWRAQDLDFHKSWQDTYLASHGQEEADHIERRGKISQSYPDGEKVAKTLRQRAATRESGSACYAVSKAGIEACRTTGKLWPWGLPDSRVPTSRPGDRPRKVLPWYLERDSVKSIRGLSDDEHQDLTDNLDMCGAISTGSSSRQPKTTLPVLT